MTDVLVHFGAHDNDKKAAQLIVSYLEGKGYNVESSNTPYIDSLPVRPYTVLVGGRCANNITCFFVNDPNASNFCGVGRDCQGSLNPITVYDRGKAFIDSVQWSSRKFIIIRGYEQEETYKAVEKIINEGWSISKIYSVGLSGKVVYETSDVEPDVAFGHEAKSAEFFVGTKIPISYRVVNTGHSGMCGVEFYADGNMVHKKSYRVVGGATRYDTFIYTMPNRSFSEFVMIYGHQKLRDGKWVFVEDGRQAVTFIRKKPEIVIPVEPPVPPVEPTEPICSAPNQTYGGKCYAPCPDDHEFISGKCYPKTEPPEPPEESKSTIYYAMGGLALAGGVLYLMKKKK